MQRLIDAGRRAETLRNGATLAIVGTYLKGGIDRF